MLDTNQVSEEVLKLLRIKMARSESTRHVLRLPWGCKEATDGFY